MNYQDKLEKLIDDKNGLILTKEVVEAGIAIKKFYNKQDFLIVIIKR